MFFGADNPPASALFYIAPQQFLSYFCQQAKITTQINCATVFARNTLHPKRNPQLAQHQNRFGWFAQ
jgi:hypothetical protein